MMIKNTFNKVLRVRRRGSNFFILSLLVLIGFIFTIIGLFLYGFYDMFFSICIGLFIGGIIMSIISTFLAEISTHELQSVDHIDHLDHADLGHIDHIDHADLGHIDHADLGHIDHVDHADLGHIDHADLGHIDHADLGHIDHVDHADLGHIDHIDHADLGHIDHVDHADLGYIDHADLGHIDHADHGDFGHVDHADQDHIDHVDHVDHADSSAFSDTTPAPFMLLFSTSLLFFGISGILFYYVFEYQVKFLLFFATIAVTYLLTKIISTIWKKIAKSRFYNISSTQNLIGQKGVIVLDVDKRGGVIKIPSNNPMKFEKIHVKPLNPDSSFDKGEEVYICDIKDGFLLVDNKVNSIQYRIKQNV